MDNNKFYTGFGDKGYTRTIKNMRILKSDTLIELLGTLDEFTSSLGVAKASVRDSVLIEDIQTVQKKIIRINGEIAGGEVSVTNECITAIEMLIDKYQAEIGGFEGFTIPGTNTASATLDVARCVCRRAERVAVKVSQFGRIRGVTLVYLNRLCDLIYAFARYAEKDTKKEATVVNNNTVSQVNLSLDMAKELAYAIEEYAAGKGLSVVIAIMDSGANLMLLHSMDNAYIASSQIAQDKAYTAVSLKMPTQTALEASRGGALDGLTATASNRMMLLGGGTPLKLGGQIVGGLGVSGGTADEDIDFAEFGALYLERRFG